MSSTAHPSYYRSYQRTGLQSSTHTLPQSSAQHISSSTRIPQHRDSILLLDHRILTTSYILLSSPFKMSYSECLTLFTNWPHDSPSPEDLSDARCSLQPTSKELDMVICQVCNTCLWDMELEDGPTVEHYRRSKSCPRFASKTDPSLLFVQHAMASPPKIHKHHHRRYHRKLRSHRRKVSDSWIHRSNMIFLSLAYFITFIRSATILSAADHNSMKPIS